MNAMVWRAEACLSAAEYCVTLEYSEDSARFGDTAQLTLHRNIATWRASMRLAA